MKIGLYDPYLDTLGGGERYVLTVAEYFLSLGHQVDLFWSGPQDILTKAVNRFNLNLANLHVVADVFRSPMSRLELIEDFPSAHHPVFPSSLHKRLTQFFTKIRVTRQYDLIFYLSDGSLPFLFSRQKLIHFQVPFVTPPSPTSRFVNRLKLSGNTTLVINSAFTARFVTKLYPCPSSVIYPPVDVDKFSPAPKENLILSVGRFDNILNAKRQDVLIDTFKHLVSNHRLSDWKLVLAGGSLDDPQKNSYLNLLRQKSAGLSVEFLINPDFSTLTRLYSKSAIFWHAAGFEVNENLQPQNTEHFGITVVEAMASGCVPVVVNAGGLPEIITPGTNGFLWKTIPEASEFTYKLISDPALQEKFRQNALATSSKFSKQVFNQSLSQLIS